MDPFADLQNTLDANSSNYTPAELKIAKLFIKILRGLHDNTKAAIYIWNRSQHSPRDLALSFNAVTRAHYLLGVLLGFDYAYDYYPHFSKWAEAGKTYYTYYHSRLTELLQNLNQAVAALHN